MSIEKEHVAPAEQTYDIFGVQLQFLVPPEQTGGKISLYRGTVPPGVMVPLHSHPEPEVFFILEGVLDVYQERGTERGWSQFDVGRVLSIPPNVRHAIRNTSSRPVSTILVTQDQLYGFFREIAEPLKDGPPEPPSPEAMQHLFGAAAKYSYWMGSPEENAAIGINLG